METLLRLKWFWVVLFVSALGVTLFVFFYKGTPKQSILRMHIESEPTTLDPAHFTGGREFQILQSIFEGLTRYNHQTLESLPGGAQRWQVSSDGTHYVFYLRQDAKWSDGKPVTAQDFWNGWERLLNPKTNSLYAFQLFYLKGAESYAKGELKDPNQIGMRVVDPYTFEVTLERPVPYFLNLTAFSALVPIRLDNEEPHLVSNGPFKFQSKDPKEGILLLPNEYYWGRKEVKLAGVQWRPFENFATALKYYDATGIDILVEVPPPQVPLLKFRSDFHAAPVLRTEYFIINCKRPGLDKKELRQALALSLNRQEITEKALQRGDLPYGFFVPPNIMPHYQNPSPGQTFDPEKAKRLFAEAGFGEERHFPTLHIHYNNASDRLLVAQAAKIMWQQNLGIEGHLVGEEWDIYLKRRKSKNFEISWGGWTGDYLDPNTFLELFTSDNRQNYTGWANKTYDALVKEAQATLDLTKRADLFKQAEAILLEEAPVIPVLVKSKTYLIQPYVKGYYPNLIDAHPLRDVVSLK
ncbi:MAG: hypothetical protein A3F82_06910 [Deltaproteobacteria bacterium RIFCSPLOWO2_12_FULL_44_12]|nr:MAG: hypothetical protein A2712_09745 [Deltaproteobacteria bacterium RIFCSPHIGHO2_01_FULL_43_49]OGQ15395.1 MAG: hypothetical protein A3D22_10275 [Deltaproteobacteria bacterium RIFCSPHIGHO2_02_FULL_44_53]OGQ29589.1 MAG: hypothetical protein A3D98_10475 [Deltaproteobacteria bacterium RIFCSPHIGHO2_12_FULL_44_21]OGQ32202.1 MAG: hypothetical protein A2979_00120 [Deltaproteobacteria bacterium RIFCSPLOWO2_01_FULL_45_74]OGQ43843.1 MAG: hypothetical protein A3I70_04015 [Deltaproteobacteria bacterium 